jgi:ubiquinone/menaquinone biosynthesis C-methylase UbiE
MIENPGRIRDDFDRIAASCAPAAGDVAQPYDRLVSSLIPANCRRLLDLGCGTGRLTRAMAPRVEQVTAVDFSSEMLRIARARSAPRANISYVEADLLSLPATLGRFDCVIRHMRDRLFPGAELRQHFLWRYTLLWTSR